MSKVKIEAVKITNNNTPLASDTLCVGCCFREEYGCAILSNMVDKDIQEQVFNLPECLYGYIYKIKE